MIVCKECGNAAESADGFCSSCGALLEWSGQRVEAAAGQPEGRQPPARRPVAERARPGPVPLAAGQEPDGPYCPACGVRNPGGRTFCRSCGGLLPTRIAAAGPPPGWWRRLLARLRGRRAYVAGDRPRGFLGHDAVPGPAVVAAGGPAAGAPAVAAGQHSHGFGLSSPGAMMGSAGRRISRARPPRRLALSRFAPLLIVVGLLGIGLGPARMWLTTHAFGLAHRAQTQLSQRYTDVVPVGASASSQTAAHPAKLAIDGVQQTYWLARQGAGARLTIRFASPQQIDRVGLLPGEPGGNYRVHARPRTITVIVAGHRPLSRSFDDTPGFQNRPVSLRGVTVITVVIKNVYPGQKRQTAAIRELEFFARV